MTIEWMEYPISLGSEADEMTITWSDGTTDVIPAHDGDGETFYQLSRLMEQIFSVENFNCFKGQSAKFIDQYPALFRSTTGVLVLRVESEENFLNAFVCKSRNAAECLLSWFNGDIIQCLEDKTYPPAGSIDFHWISVKEMLAMIGAGLLDDFPPIVFDPNEDLGSEVATPESLGFIPVELPWWSPPPRNGPVFTFPACLFELDSYSQEATIEQLSETSVAISLTQNLSQDEWVHLLQGCQTGSIANRIVNDSDGFAERFERVSELAMELGPTWLERWRNFY